MQIPEHVTGGERRQEHVFGVRQPRVSTQARVVRTVDDRLARRRHAPATIIAAIAARSFAAIAGPLDTARKVMLGQRHDQSSFMRSEEHTSELQSLMRISYAVLCLKKNKNQRKALNINNLSQQK